LTPTSDCVIRCWEVVIESSIVVTGLRQKGPVIEPLTGGFFGVGSSGSLTGLAILSEISVWLGFGVFSSPGACPMITKSSENRNSHLPESERECALLVGGTVGRVTLSRIQQGKRISTGWV
jgi:hypothetical protein